MMLNSAKVGSPLYLNSSHVVRVKPLQGSTNIGLGDETGNESFSAQLYAHITKQWVGKETTPPSSVLRENLASSKPLKEICPACFGQSLPAEIGVISFDGCMQQRRLKGKMKEDPTDERRNRLMFVDDEPEADGVDVHVFLLQYAYDFRLMNLEM